ncbi:MAG: MATE family efflux transporter, partial [Candidatus Krumholzibacteria bacterium]|nr:MATE family efflux transporter [Candidatus Krumholzibacteria bacterium]
GRTLARLTVPMVAGIAGMVAFNLTDAFFVGRLGARELAAIGFTFPVVALITRVAMGIGVGASAVISRAVGRGDRRMVRRLTTDSLTLAICIVALFVAGGFAALGPLFGALGAEGEILGLVREYMEIWLAGVIFVVFPMVSNNAIRANGDMKTPAMIMIVAVVVNIVLDPLLIFGIGPFPRLELAGAALATVIARAVQLVVSFWVVCVRRRMVTFERRPLVEVLDSWRSILYIGIPAAATRLIEPLGIAVVTGIIASGGPKGVAAYGVAVRIEFLAMAVVFALASVLGPFVGQNWGAGRRDRIMRAISLSNRFTLLWGLGVFAALSLPARAIAGLFSGDPEVVGGVAIYLRTAAAAYCLYGGLVISTFIMNVLHRPLHASGLAIGQMFLLTVPMAWAGWRLGGLAGSFAGVGLSYALAGVAARLVLRGVLGRLEERG